MLSDKEASVVSALSAWNGVCMQAKRTQQISLVPYKGQT